MLKVGLNSLVAQRVKHRPGMRETRVRSLGQGRSPGEGNGNPFQYSCLENPMDGEPSGLQSHSSILAWRIPWTESLVGYSPWGCKESDTTERLHFLSLPPLPRLHPSRTSQSVRLGSLCYTETSQQLSILHMIAYIC